jgi:LPXTG-site transpeptidase (sortase) family protein
MIRNYLMILAGFAILLFAVSRTGIDLVLAVSEPVIVELPEDEIGAFLPFQEPEQFDKTAVSQVLIERLSPSFTAVYNHNGMEPLYLPAQLLDGDEPAAAPPLKRNPVSIDEGVDNSENLFIPSEPAVGETPVRLVIPKIKLNVAVVPSRTAKARYGGKEFLQWMAPDYFAVGWHKSSALLGLPGNTVLSGHHNDYGEVFRYLEKLEEGDLIYVQSDTKEYIYVVANRMILPEKYENPEVRLENARWIQPSSDERLTLITCWPYHTNTHRLILVASPILLKQ